MVCFLLRGIRRDGFLWKRARGGVYMESSRAGVSSMRGMRMLRVICARL